MDETNSNGSRIGFGPFEVDVAAGQVYKNGRLVRLPEQPFQVLAALLDHPGEVVTREELQEKLWAGETFVDFDQGLNNAINKLRDALGDSAANPRYIETLPRRGYRFIHSVTEGAGSDIPPPVPVVGRKLWLTPALLGIAALATLAVSLATLRNTSPERPFRRFSFRPEAGVRWTDTETALSVSPNGKYIAYAGLSPPGLWVQDLTVEEPRLIKGSEGSPFGFWSPDSEFIFYSGGGELRKVRVQGGPSTLICRYKGDYAMGTVSPDGNTIIFADGHPPGLYQVPASGGEPQPLFSDAERDELFATYTNGVKTPISHPRFLPVEAADRILFFDLGFPGSRVQTMMVLNMDTGRRAVLGPGIEIAYSPTGHFVYKKGADLWAAEFSQKTMRMVGEPFLVRPNSQGPTISSDGTLVYLDGSIPRRQLVWRDRTGRMLGAAGEPYPIRRGYGPLRISPDGAKVLFATVEGGASEIWVYDLVREMRSRLTTDPADDYTSAWSPDGMEIVFTSNRNGEHDIFLKEYVGGGEAMQLPSTPAREVVSDWSRDGNRILYRVNREGTRSDLAYLERGEDGGWTSHAYIQTEHNETEGRFSPSGRFVAYQSDESGRLEVYVRRFPDNGRRLHVSRNGGQNPRWRGDAKELFYTEGNTLIAVPFSAELEQPFGQLVRLFEQPAFDSRLWDVSSDGQRFLLAERVGHSPQPQIRVVQNWYEEFRNRERP